MLYGSEHVFGVIECVLWNIGQVLRSVEQVVWPTEQAVPATDIVAWLIEHVLWFTVYSPLSGGKEPVL